MQAVVNQWLPPVVFSLALIRSHAIMALDI